MRRRAASGCSSARLETGRLRGAWLGTAPECTCAAVSTRTGDWAGVSFPPILCSSNAAVMASRSWSWPAVRLLAAARVVRAGRAGRGAGGAQAPTALLGAASAGEKRSGWRRARGGRARQGGAAGSMTRASSPPLAGCRASAASACCRAGARLRPIVVDQTAFAQRSTNNRVQITRSHTRKALTEHTGKALSTSLDAALKAARLRRFAGGRVDRGLTLI